MGQTGPALRVLHLVTRSHQRGAEVFARELAAACDELGHSSSVRAIGLAVDGGSVPTLTPLVRSARLGLRTCVTSWWRLRRLLRDEPADVVVAHGGWAALVVAFSVRSSSALRVWQRILGLPIDTWGAVRRRAWGAISARFDGVVALTEEMDDEMRALGYEGPVWVIGNARDPGRFWAVHRPTAARELREELAIDDDVPLLGFVGHLVPQKRAEIAVEVLAEVRRDGHPAHLVIAGDGPGRCAVERRVAELAVEKAVTLLGHRDDPETVFAAADITLITSDAEGIPGVAIEAQMTGCPVVTFLRGGVEEVVEDGQTGVVVPWPDPLLMARSVSSLLERPDLLGSMSAAATARSEAFTTEDIAARYLSRFQALHDQRPSSAR